MQDRTHPAAGSRAPFWRVTAFGSRYHSLRYNDKPCPVHGARFWLVDQVGRVVEFPTFAEAVAYGRQDWPGSPRFKLVDCFSKRVIVDTLEHVPEPCQLDLFAEG